MATYEEYYDEQTVKAMAEAGVPVAAKEAMTCNQCPDVAKCELAWDPYNSEGDCLASK